MTKYKKEIEIDAVQFTGNNLKTVQNFVGDRALDPAGKYTIPLFDEADTWMPDRGATTYSHVLNVRGMWVGVEDGSWIIRDEFGQFVIMTDAEFHAAYIEPTETNKKDKS